MIGGDRGQSTLEFALVLPLIALLLLGLFQVGVIARDRVALVHAAREGVRVAVMDPSPDRVAAAVREATSLDPSAMRVELTGGDHPGDLVTVVVRYTCRTDVALSGSVVPDVEMAERLSAIIE
jgi:Flp pilus assembly protein TadG